jgi:hypothetical protein
VKHLATVLRMIEVCFGTHPAWLNINEVTPWAICEALKLDPDATLRFTKVFQFTAGGELYRLQHSHAYHGLVLMRYRHRQKHQIVRVFTNATSYAEVRQTFRVLTKKAVAA